MQGQVLKFRSDIGVGVIQGEDGRNYRFLRGEIVNADAGLCIVGEDVDFVVVARKPRAIFLTSGSPWTAFGPVSRA